MLAHNRGTGVALSYVWERETFPWLMTWEENNARMDKPWNGRTLTRGLEISSYAFALGRKANVEMGALFDTPTFEWLDAYETKSTKFHLSIQALEAGQPTPKGCVLTGLFAAEDEHGVMKYLGDDPKYTHLT